MIDRIFCFEAETRDMVLFGDIHVELAFLSSLHDCASDTDSLTSQKK